jgi:Tfp pilus assembly protein PilN
VTTQTVQTAGIATLPRVNLMPPEIAEALRFRRLQLAMGGAVLVAAVAVAGLYMHAKSGISGAQSQLTTAQGQQTALQTKLNGLASVKSTFADVQSKQQLLQQAMGQEIRWSYMLNDLSFRIPSDVWLTSVQASEDTVGVGDPTQAAATTTPVPGAVTTSLGSVVFSGIAFKHDDVATWLDALAKEKGFIQPTFTSSTEEAIGTRGVVGFNTSVQLTSHALSNRYTTKAGS